MNLLEMSFSGMILILAIVIIRPIFINRLPKKTFWLLWNIVLLRLLVPFRIPFEFSVYSLLNKLRAPGTITKVPVAKFMPELDIEQTVTAGGMLNSVADLAVSGWGLLWGIGMILCMVFFIIAYMRCYREFQISLPVDSIFVKRWLKEHKRIRNISIRQSGSIQAPLTYGITRSVILLPKNTDWENYQQLEYILQHEYTHICHFDTWIKMITVIALCIHWFNPLVWVMYVLFNRDIELVCDESVVRRLGEGRKASYARMLIDMEEIQSGFMPLCNNFSKHAMEERIISIMKTKKMTFGAIFAAVVIITSVVMMLTTSAMDNKEENVYAEFINGLAEEQPYAVIDINEEFPVLLLPEGIYDNGNGDMVTFYSDVYYMIDDVPQKIGTISGAGTAYPLAYDKRGIYAASGHGTKLYEIDEGTGTLIGKDVIEGYRQANIIKFN